jgi:hypothetical protein
MKPSCLILPGDIVITENIGARETSMYQYTDLIISIPNETLDVYLVLDDEGKLILLPDSIYDDEQEQKTIHRFSDE